MAWCSVLSHELGGVNAGSACADVCGCGRARAALSSVGRFACCCTMPGEHAIVSLTRTNRKLQHPPPLARSSHATHRASLCALRPDCNGNKMRLFAAFMRLSSCYRANTKSTSQPDRAAVRNVCMRFRASGGGIGLSQASRSSEGFARYDRFAAAT